MNFLLSGYLTYSVSFLAVFMALATVLHLQFYITGIVNFGIVGFWGLGMYLCAIFLLKLSIPFVPAILLAAVATGLVSLLLGRIILNLDSQAVLVGTLALAKTIEELSMTQKNITKGVIGLGTVEMPFDIGRQYTDFVYMLIIVIFLVLIILYAFKIKKTPYGRLLLSIKDNESLSQGLGKPSFKHKVIFFTITCTAIAFLGGLTAPLYSYLYPRMITSTVTFTVWIALLLGGQSKISGGIVGVLATVFVFDYLLTTIIKLPGEYSQIIPNIKYFIYGLSLVFILMFRPSGILGEKKREARG